MKMCDVSKVLVVSGFLLVTACAANDEGERVDAVDPWALSGELMEPEAPDDPEEPQVPIDPEEPIEPEEPEEPLEPEDPIEPAPLIPEHAFCSAPLPLTPGETIVGEEFTDDLELAPRCNGDLRRTLHYSVDVPEGHRLLASGAVVEMRRGCNGLVCLGGTSWLNTNQRDEQVILQTFGEVGERYSLWVDTFELAENARCEAPRELGFDEVLVDQDIRQGSVFEDYCGLVGGSGRYVRYYSVTFEIGRDPWSVVLRARAKNPRNTSISLQVLQTDFDGSCGLDDAPRCVAYDDEYFRSSPVAEVRVGYGDVGIGQEYATALIAVSMGSPDFSDEASSLFDIEVEPLR